MRVLVTGGSGFLGSHVVDALVTRGDSVRVLVRPTSEQAYLAQKGVELVAGDLGDTSVLRQAASDVDWVIHCAALAADWGPWAAFRQANVEGVRHVLDAALQAGVRRVVHVSSSDVYGHPDRPVDETAPFRRRGWPYVDTKIVGEELVWSYHQRHGLPVTVVRPASIYGPRSRSFVLEIARLLRSGQMAHIGFRARSAGLAYVTNVVDLILLAAESEASLGQAYNVTDGLSTTWREYVTRLAHILGVPSPWVTLPYRAAYLLGWGLEVLYGALHIRSRPLVTRMIAAVFGTHQGFSIAKAQRELDYSPRVGLEEGLARVARWLNEIRFV